MVFGGPLLDPAEQAAAQQRLGLVLEATGRMTDSLDVLAVAEGLAETVVPAFADGACVELVDDILVPGGTSLPGAPMRRVAVAGRPVDGQTVQPDHTYVVPLIARGRVLGRASFRRLLGRPAYAPADLALADELAARAAVALDNVRLYDEARATAVELQRSLLPTTQPRITGVEMAHRYLPGSRETEVGGDWFDVLPLSCGRVAFVIGDVMGRGLRAAAAMGQLRTAVRMLAVLDLMPDELLSQLDHLAMGIAQVQLATCVYAVFDPITMELCFATAGHPPPAVRDPDGLTRFLPTPSGAPLGVGGVPFEAAPESVADGTRLLIYTDGLIESRGADLDDGLASLAAAFTDGPAGLEPLCDHILQILGRAEGHDDDVAMLIVELRALEQERIVSWRVLADDTEVARSRNRVRSALLHWELPELVETAELLVSELATNALRYGRGPIDLQVLLLDEVVTFSVTDTEAPLPRFRRSSADDEGGRGLQLVASLATRWGARATPTGKVVWCELPRSPSPLS